MRAKSQNSVSKANKKAAAGCTPTGAKQVVRKNSVDLDEQFLAEMQERRLRLQHWLRVIHEEYGLDYQRRGPSRPSTRSPRLRGAA